MVLLLILVIADQSAVVLFFFFFFFLFKHLVLCVEGGPAVTSDFYCCHFMSNISPLLAKL